MMYIPKKGDFVRVKCTKHNGAIDEFTGVVDYVESVCYDGDNCVVEISVKIKGGVTRDFSYNCEFEEWCDLYYSSKEVEITKIDDPY